MEIFNKKLSLPVVIALLCIISYFPALFAPKTVNPDIELVWNALPTWSNLTVYFQELINFRVIDFQPVRDLTIYIDWFFFEHFSINTAIIQNLLYWWISLFFISRIISLECPNLTRQQILLGVLLFSIYPLFAVSLVWGMARKHILAFMFLSIGTSIYLKYKSSTLNWKTSLVITSTYVLSVFSQPIGILWPFWVLIDAFMTEGKRKIPFRLLTLLGIVFLIGFFINLNYYEQSEIFKESFNSKTSDAFNFADKILAIGHYFFELFLPYNQGFYSDLGSPTVLIGLVIFIFSLLIFFKDKANLKENLRWIIFGFLPLAIILNTPKLLFSTYLLIPALGLFLIFMKHLQQWSLPKWKILFPVLVIVWSGLNIYESTLWTDTYRFAHDKNFSRKPNCVTASRFVRLQYMEGKRPETALRQFLVENECLQVDTKYKMMDFIVLRSHMIYYDSEINLQDRLKELEQLGNLAFYPNLIRAALMIENKFSGADEIIRDSISKLGDEHIPPQNDLIIAKTIKPYCHENQMQDCLKVVEKLTVSRTVPFF